MPVFQHFSITYVSRDTYTYYIQFIVVKQPVEEIKQLYKVYVYIYNLPNSIIETQATKVIYTLFTRKQSAYLVVVETENIAH